MIFDNKNILRHKKIFTEILPRYMYSMSRSIWSSEMSLKKTVGCLQGLEANRARKYGLQAVSTSLCAE